MISKHEVENIRSLYNQDLSSLQKQYLNTESHDVFHYIYTGEVLSNSDPLKQGRLKIRVINLFDSLTVDEIPWATPAQSFTDGSFTIPEVGIFLEVFFDHGDVYAPVYLSKALNLNQIPSQASKDYPNTIVLYQTKNGSYCTLNRSTGEYKIVHPLGSKITMTAGGVVEIDAQIIKLQGVGGNSSGGYVVPNATNMGGLSCIPVCPVFSSSHNGSTLINNP